MALTVPSGPSWAFCSDNLSATPGTPATSTSIGTSVAVNGTTANTNGTAVTLLSALSHDVEYIVISISRGSFTDADTSSLMDILVDPAGGTSWSEIISDLLCGYANAFGSNAQAGPAYQYHFPLWIPAGASVGARRQCASTTAVQAQVIIQAYGGNKNPASWACGQRVQTVGTMSTGTSRGQAHTSGDSGAFSSWTSLGSALAGRGIAAQWSAQCEGSTSVNALGYHFEFGAGSTRIGPRVFHLTGSSEQVACIPTGPIFYDFQDGIQLEVRGACSGTAESVDVAAYIVS